MSKIHQLPDIGEAEQEASAWIARLHADDVTPDDLARFEAWLAAHPRHAQAYEGMARTVAEVKRAGRIVRAVSFGNAMSAAAVPAKSDGAAPGRTLRSIRLGLAAAAVILVVAVASVWLTMREGSQTVFQTAIGEHASVELPDGSRLELNTNSVAQVHYTESARTIRLARGEAFFSVVHDMQRPFWVVAGDSWIRAVGTAFNVDMRASGTNVLVSEGTVKLASHAARDEPPSDALLGRAPVSILTAGQHAQMTAGVAEIRAVAPLEMLRLAAWRHGKVYFENQQLQAVVQELSRYSTYRIAIEDESLRELPIGGTFQANSQGVNTLLNLLGEGFGLRIRRESGNRIYIENPPAAE